MRVWTLMSESCIQHRNTFLAIYRLPLLNHPCRPWIHNISADGSVEHVKTYTIIIDVSSRWRAWWRCKTTRLRRTAVLTLADICLLAVICRRRSSRWLIGTNATSSSSIIVPFRLLLIVLMAAVTKPCGLGLSVAVSGAIWLEKPSTRTR